MERDYDIARLRSQRSELYDYWRTEGQDRGRRNVRHMTYAELLAVARPDFDWRQWDCAWFQEQLNDMVDSHWDFVAEPFAQGWIEAVRDFFSEVKGSLDFDPTPCLFF